MILLHFKGLSSKGAAVRPLGNFTYHWTVPQHVGPTATDPPCLTWMYSSAVDPTRDTNSGLVGPLVVCRPGILDHSNKQVLAVGLSLEKGDPCGSNLARRAEWPSSVFPCCSLPGKLASWSSHIMGFRLVWGSAGLCPQSDIPENHRPRIQEWSHRTRQAGSLPSMSQLTGAFHSAFSG